MGETWKMGLFNKSKMDETGIKKKVEKNKKNFKKEVDNLHKILYTNKRR